ncbi:hypothetical protein PILCRDRAFT_17517 [Piloderma croceum F 1598]|uniref:Uncharacterized protein n=1 Tax=Piloderma croceum (strain F 1598) TaxID=765440 RepID=A0A0C3B165_PILCF|nr:hypothetical protein PILCRDRAFT_17517 [Piloderma croceum F 1598]
MSRSARDETQPIATTMVQYENLEFIGNEIGAALLGAHKYQFTFSPPSPPAHLYLSNDNVLSLVLIGDNSRRISLFLPHDPLAPFISTRDRIK